MRVTSPAVTIKDIWDALAASYVAVGSFGKLLNDYLDAPVSGAKADLTTLETRLSAARATALDQLLAANLPTDIADILADVTGIAGAAMRGTDGAALASAWTAARAAKVDNLDATVASRLAASAYASERGSDTQISASETLQLSSDGQVTNNTTSYVKVKEFQVGPFGVYRVKFDLNVDFDGRTAKGQIYKNGVAHGTERTTTTVAYDTWTEDLYFDAGDLCQLYIRVTSPGWIATAKNVRLYATIGQGVGVEVSV